MGAGDAIKTVAITAVDLTKTYLMFSFSSPNNLNPSNYFCRGRFTSTTEITFSRDTAGTAFDIRWQAVEFSTGVVVQSGTLTMAASTENQLITAVDLTKAFVVMTYENGGSTLSEDDLVLAELTSTTNLQFRNQGSGPIIDWFVIEYTDAVVQSGTVLLTDLSFSVTDAITAVDLTKSWMIFTQSFTSGTPSSPTGDKMIRGRFTSTTQLTFDRDIDNEEIEISWFVIEHTDTTLVQSGTEPFSTVETLKNITLAPPVDLGRSMITMGGSFGYRGGKTPYNVDDNLLAGTFLGRFNIITNQLQLERENAASVTADVAWFVVSFGVDGAVTMITFGGLFMSLFSGAGVGVKGTFVQMTANVGTATKWIMITIQPPFRRGVFLDIATFSGTIIYPDLFWDGGSSAAVESSPFCISLPLDLGAGQGISLRVADEFAGIVGYGAQVFLSDQPFTRATINAVQSSNVFMDGFAPLGPVTGAVPFTYGPFLELIPSLDFAPNYASFQILRNHTGGGTATNFAYQVATGPVGAEVVQMGDVGYNIIHVGGGQMRNASHDLPVAFTAGARLSVRVNQNLAGVKELAMAVTIFGKV